MTEIERICEQLKRAFDGPAWHGPAVMEALQGVTAAQASRRPIAGAHTIWEIVLHIATWEDSVRRRALGEGGEVSDEQDWPAITWTTPEAWQQTLDRLRAGHMELRKVVAAYDPAKLDEPRGKGDHTAYVLFHGVIQHDLYHAGQIAILRKE